MLKTISFVVLLFFPPFAFSFILFLRCCNFILDGHFTFTFLSNFDNVVFFFYIVVVLHHHDDGLDVYSLMMTYCFTCIFHVHRDVIISI